MTQDLIKQMREEYAKQQEEKLIQEQVEQINLEANAAPTPSATNTPQAVLDRTVATIKKVNETKAGIEYASIKKIDIAGKTQADLYPLFGQSNVNNYFIIGSYLVYFNTYGSPSGPNGDMHEFSILSDPSGAISGSIKITNGVAQPPVITTTQIASDKANGNLKVNSTGATKVDLSEMDGSTLAKTLTTEQRQTEWNSSAIASANSATDAKLAALKVYANDGTTHSISEMDGTTADKTLITRQFNATKLATKQDTLTRTLTLVLDDGTTTDIKVG